jgi:excisionase family DNA binding protein
LQRLNLLCMAEHAMRGAVPARDRKVDQMFEQHLGRSVTIDQAAALLHVSRRTIYNRIRDGKLQTIRTIGGSQRVLLSSLDESRRPVWSTSEPARESVAGVAAITDRAEAINPFVLRATHTDARNRQES